MRLVPLERDINIAVNGPFWVEAANPEHPFTAMMISHSRGTCFIRSMFGALAELERERAEGRTSERE